MWYLKNPPSGTANVTVNLLGLTNAAAGAVSFSGVDPINTFGAIASDSSTGTGTTNPSTTVASGTNNLVIDAVALEGDAGALTAGAGQTQRWTATTGGAASNIRGVGSTEAGAASVTMSWTKANTAKWAILAASINVNPVPSLSVLKFADLPTPMPGDVVTFSATTTNSGMGAAVSLVSNEAVPANTDFKLRVPRLRSRDLGAHYGGGVLKQRRDHLHLYAGERGRRRPAGFDRTVTHVRWTMTGNLSQVSPNNSYGVSFQARIR